MKVYIAKEYHLTLSQGEMDALEDALLGANLEIANRNKSDIGTVELINCTRTGMLMAINDAKKAEEV